MSSALLIGGYHLFKQFVIGIRITHKDTMKNGIFIIENIQILLFENWKKSHGANEEQKIWVFRLFFPKFS